MAWVLGKDSFSKMTVYFKNQHKGLFWNSIDWKHKYSKVRDKQIGLARFEKKIQEWGDKAETVLIFDKVTDQLIAKYKSGNKVPID